MLQRIHEWKNRLRNAAKNTTSQLEIESKTAKDQLKAQHNKIADLKARVFKLESMIEDMKAELTQAKTYKADLASKAATQEQNARTNAQRINILTAQLEKKEAEVARAVVFTTARLRDKQDQETELDNVKKECTNLKREKEEYKEELEGLEREKKDLEEQVFNLARVDVEFQLFQDASKENEEDLKAIVKKGEAQYDDLFKAYTALDNKAQNDIKLLGHLQIENGNLERKLQQELADKRNLHKEIGRLRSDSGDKMDETGDNTWVQRASEAELLLKTRDLQIKNLEHKVRDLERYGTVKTPVPLPQPRVIQPLRTINTPSPSAAPVASGAALNVTPSDAAKRLDFAHMDEARVRKDLSSYIQNALDSVVRWNKACFSGSAGADKVAKNFSTMLANWEYLQEDMIRDEKLLRAVKAIVGIEGRWANAPPLAEIMGGKEPARDRMVKVASLFWRELKGKGRRMEGKE